MRRIRSGVTRRSWIRLEKSFDNAQLLATSSLRTSNEMNGSRHRNAGHALFCKNTASEQLVKVLSSSFVEMSIFCVAMGVERGLLFGVTDSTRSLPQLPTLRRRKHCAEHLGIEQDVRSGILTVWGAANTISRRQCDGRCQINGRFDVGSATL